VAVIASLIQVLSVAGSRKSDGSVNAGGLVYVYAAGSTTEAKAYAYDGTNYTQLSQPITLDSGGKSDLYVIQQVDLHIEDSAGAAVQTVYRAASTIAGSEQLSNTGWTATTVDGALTSLYGSTGAADGQYKESSGATARNLQAVLSDPWVSVKDFGATGDGSTDDTSAVQSAISRVIARGGGTVLLPKGTYLVSSALAITSGNGVTLRGVSRYASVLKSNSGSANVITASQCTGLILQDFALQHSSTSSGCGIQLAGCTDVSLRGLYYRTSGWLVGVDITDASSHSVAATRNALEDCYILSAGSNNCAVRIGNSTGISCSGFRIHNCTLAAAVTGSGVSLAIGGYANDIAVSDSTLGVSGAAASLLICATSTSYVSAADTTCKDVRVTNSRILGTVTYVIEPTGVRGFTESDNYLATTTRTDNARDSLFMSRGWFAWPVGQRLEPNTNTKTISNSTDFTPDISIGNVWRLTADNASTSCTIQLPANGPPAEGTVIWLFVNVTNSAATVHMSASYKPSSGVDPDMSGSLATLYHIIYINAHYYVISRQTRTP
jgi:hypothetical protein